MTRGFRDLQPGELVLFPLPFDPAGKARPAVVISSNAVHQSTNGCLILPITSAPQGGPNAVPIGGRDPAYGALDRPRSCVVLDKVAWADFGRVGRRFGRVRPEFLSGIMGDLASKVLCRAPAGGA